MLGPVIPDSTSAPRLAALARAALQAGGRGWAAPDFIAFGEAPGAVVIADGGLAAGLILLRVAADESEIVDLGVVPARRRRGLGRALLWAAEAEAWHRGARRMALEVAIDNAAARTLYAAAGYATVGQRPAYYRRADGSCADALILARDLAPPACGRLHDGLGDREDDPRRKRS